MSDDTWRDFPTDEDIEAAMVAMYDDAAKTVYFDWRGMARAALEAVKNRRLQTR